MNYDLRQRIIFCREASKVTRCHNFPWFGDYTVGQHSFDMLTLALQLVPDEECTPNLLRGIIAHDLAERMVGDMPAPFKWAVPEVTGLLEEAEDAIIHAVKMDVGLTPEEEHWLHILDRVELWLAAHEQMELGNRNARVMAEAVEGWFRRTELPDVVHDFVNTYRHERLRDELPE